MPRGIPNAKPIIEAHVEQPAAVKMVAMKLERHYLPVGAYEVVGYLKPALTRKNAAGELIVVEPEKFIPGEQAPPPFPGVVNAKVWASTTIKLAEDEAKNISRLGIAKRDFDD